MSILYTIGNKNLGTINLVAKAVFKTVEKNKMQSIQKVIIFNTSESNLLLKNQVDIYRDFFGEVRIEEIMLDRYGLSQPKDFSCVFKEEDQKIIDLTNGQKTTASLLYLSASLLGIENIFYLSLKVLPKELPIEPEEGKHYEYIRIPKIGSIAELAKISYFDLIYYIDEMNMLLNISSGYIHRVKKDIESSIIGFFKNDSARSSISNATTYVEVFVKTFIEFLEEYPPAVDFAKKHGIQLRQKDPIGAITFFLRKYREMHGTDENITTLITLPGLLSALRNYRNISAHSGIIIHEFKNDEVRIVISMALETFRRAKQSNELWNKLISNN